MSPSLLASITSVASSPIFFKIASSPLLNNLATYELSGEAFLRASRVSVNRCKISGLFFSWFIFSGSCLSGFLFCKSHWAISIRHPFPPIAPFPDDDRNSLRDRYGRRCRPHVRLSAEPRHRRSRGESP